MSMRQNRSGGAKNIAMSNIVGVLSVLQRPKLLWALMAIGLAASTSLLAVTAFHLSPATSSEPCWLSSTAVWMASANQQEPSSRWIDPPFNSCASSSISRRNVFSKGVIRAGSILSTATLAATWLASPAQAAKPDCYTDCFANCRAVAPKDLDYCRDSCLDYCQQPDREDGLSGSVSAAKGETGILGGSFGQGTVPKGQDKPPSLIQFPGLDFSSATGRKLIGY